MGTEVARIVRGQLAVSAAWRIPLLDLFSFRVVESNKDTLNVNRPVRIILDSHPKLLLVIFPKRVYDVSRKGTPHSNGQTQRQYHY